MTHLTSHPAFRATLSAVFSDDPQMAPVQLNLPLTRPLSSVVQAKHLRMCDRFHKFRLAGPDLIKGRLGIVGSHHAKERIAEVAKTIRFMDVTGLVPTPKEIYGYTTCSKDQRLPGQDHASTWLDPATKTIVMLDEPYGYVDQMFPDRKGWAARHGLEIRRLDYAGTYRSDPRIVCDLVFLTSQKTVAQKIISRIETLASLPEIQDSVGANLDA
jgi:hypothetical protein